MTPSPQTPTTRLRFLQQWTSLGGLMKYGALFSAFLVFLPLTAIHDVPLHGILGGLFVDLTPWEIYFVSIALLGLAWSLMFTEGLIVNSIGSWLNGGLAYRRVDANNPTGYVPAWAEKFFSVPVTPPQFAFFSLLVVPGLLVVVDNGVAGVTRATLAAALGVLTAYGLLIVLSAPAAIVDRDDLPMRGMPLAGPIWSWLTSIGPLVSAVQAVHRAVSWVLQVFGLNYMLGPDPTGRGRVVHPPHFIAITNATGLVVLIALTALVFSPVSPKRADAPGGEAGTPAVGTPAGVATTAAAGGTAPSWLGRVLPSELPAVMYLYIMAITLVLTLTMLQFHLGRLRVSPVATLVLIVILGYGWSALDHYFRIVRRPPPRPENALTPVAIARGSGKNIVVVVASGGGILAAGWTTLALEKLIEARPELRREIRLLSTISGGSVGAAYFLDSTLRGEPPAAAKVKSTRSSLAATAYGFAFLDLPRLVTGGLVSSTRDRGILLENEWLAIANGTVSGGRVDKHSGVLTDRSLASLRDPIRQGIIPAPIFGATLMESGRRVMITPIDFPGQADRRRGETLSEFLLDGDEADVSVWTAARLSATFAFVSPAARADIPPPLGKTAPVHQAHHFIDGGYYDNFGVTSALDWLEPVLRAREQREAGLDFERVLVVQLRAFRRANPKELRARTGAIAALLGPFIGLEAIRDGAAVSRNDIELARFAGAWKTRLRAVAPDRPFDICLATLQPPPGAEGPLSWHLTADDKKRLENTWTPLEASAVIAYLAGTGPCPEPVN